MPLFRSQAENELARQDRHRHLSPVSRINDSRARLPWVGHERCHKTLEPFHDRFGIYGSTSLVPVTSYMLKLYPRVIVRRFSQAFRSLAHFHILADMSETIG